MLVAGKGGKWRFAECRLEVGAYIPDNEQRCVRRLNVSRIANLPYPLKASPSGRSELG